MGLRKINTIGIRQANKVMHLSAIAHNLMKYLEFIEKRSKNGAAVFAFKNLVKSNLHDLFLAKLKAFATVTIVRASTYNSINKLFCPYCTQKI
tara:strand:+ start:558 stop:836 length:279 start_codon:yes stop_codon:yes gene_type:complete